MPTALSPRIRAFTIVEMLVAMAVFMLLVVVVAQIVGNASTVTTESRKRFDAESQARLVLDRLAQDFGRMSKRGDLDFLFAKQGGNDRLFFISEVQGYFDGTATANKSGLSLVGYRVNDSLQVDRLGKGLSWSGGTGNNEINFITFDPANQGNSFEPLPASTLAANPATQAGSADIDFHVISDAVFRLEFCYLLKDGTFSTKPVSNPATLKNSLGSSSAPSVSDDSAKGYSVGSRWYDTSAQRAYICRDATTNSAVWSALGWKDVTALVVAVAALDPTSRQLASNLQQAVTALPDVTDADLQGTAPQLMDQKWNNLIRSGSFASSAGLPTKAASAVRVYQRYFYLNAP